MSAKLRVILLFALGYLVSYLYRGINLGFAPLLMRDLGIGAAELGLLTSLYFLGFAIAQIPVGVLMDQYGPKRVNVAFLMIAALGAFCFGQAETIPGLMIGRLLIGVGVAACLGAAFKAFTQWFKLDQLPALNGLVMAIGGVGGVLTGAPLAWLLVQIDWRTVSVGLAALTLVSALVIGVFVPDVVQSRSGMRLIDQLKGVAEVLKSGTFHRIALFSILTQAVFYMMQSLWMGAFLTDVYRMTQHEAASIVSLVGIMMVVGCMGTGMLAHWLTRSGVVTLYTFTGIAMGLFLLDQIVILLQVPINPVWLWGVFGLLGSSGILTYALLAKHFRAELIGRINASITLLIFLSIFALQTIVGVVLSQWPTSNGHFPVAAYQTTWVLLIALQLVGAILYIVPTSRSLKYAEIAESTQR